MMRRIIIAVATMSLLWTAPPAAGQSRHFSKSRKRRAPASKGLSLEQIRRLMAVPLPDSAIAQEIQSRGIHGEFTRHDIEVLRQEGAGTNTVAALTRLLPVASLTVKTEPEAFVTLDHGTRVRTASDGTAVFSGIDPGAHQVLIQKTYHKDVSRMIDLTAREDTSLSAPLEWAVGFLSITAQPAGATITVSGGAPQTGRVEHLAVPIGTVEVVVTAPLRETSSQNVNIQPGKESTLSISLALDQNAISRAAGQIHALFRTGNYPAVRERAGQFFAAGARDPAVSGEFAMSFLELHDYPAFQNAARQALAAGATLRIPMLHVELGYHPNNHLAFLQVSSQRIGFQPVGHCNHPAFQVSIRDVHLGKRRVMENLFVVELVVPNPTKPKKSLNINLAGDFVKVNAVRALLQYVLG
jgi:hypothetical protein